MEGAKELLQLAHRDFPLEKGSFHCLSIDDPKGLVLTILLPPRWVQVYIDEEDLKRSPGDVWNDVLGLLEDQQLTTKAQA